MTPGITVGQAFLSFKIFILFIAALNKKITRNYRCKPPTVPTFHSKNILVSAFKSIAIFSWPQISRVQWSSPWCCVSSGQWCAFTLMGFSLLRWMLFVSCFRHSYSLKAVECTLSCLKRFIILPLIFRSIIQMNWIL